MLCKTLHNINSFVFILIFLSNSLVIQGAAGFLEYFLLMSIIGPLFTDTHFCLYRLQLLKMVTHFLNQFQFVITPLVILPRE